MDCKKIAILASGNGSNAINLIHHARKISSLKIVCVVTDNPNAKVIKKCQKLNTLCFIVSEKTKDAFEQNVLELLAENKVDWILLAGFMKILSENFLKNYYDHTLKINRVINIHPSLLPLYRGKDAYEQAFNENVTKSGVTIHFVDGKVDTGPIILQDSFIKKNSDSFQGFKDRGVRLEHFLYPKILDFIEKDKISYKTQPR